MHANDIPTWADREAWEAMYAARRRVQVLDITGKLVWLQEWQARHAPSIGARARAILNTLLYPPSFIAACEDALALYLSPVQTADRPGFWRPRRSNAPQVFRGVKHYG